MDVAESRYSRFESNTSIVEMARDGVNAQFRAFSDDHKFVVATSVECRGDGGADFIERR